MAHSHAEPIQVRHRDGTPSQFLWRDRLYVVREVLAEWVESAAWWRVPALAGLTTGLWPPAVGADVGLGQLQEADRELWRVAAGCGRAGGGGVFELTHLPAQDRWLLTGVLD